LGVSVVQYPERPAMVKLRLMSLSVMLDRDDVAKLRELLSTASFHCATCAGQRL
jgi:hypothetical protein